ncbi:retrotransposon-related protein [Tanacetum coccineum]
MDELHVRLNILRLTLRKFTLVFFDDILVYSKIVEEHCAHLQQDLEVTRHNKLFAKQSKCSFVVKKVEYLRHVITGEGVATDPSKIEEIKNWPVPSTLKQLRGFLGLSGYYRRFIKSYAMGMMETLVLGLPDFNQEFVIETDASGTGIGAVLCQNGHPLAYLSKTLSIKHQSLYLCKGVYGSSGSFGKMERKGIDNAAGDALSRVNQGAELLQTIVSSVASDVMDKIKASWQSDNTMQQLIKSLKDNSYKGDKLVLEGGMLKRKGKIMKGLKRMVRQFVKECDTCQRQKPDLSAYLGFLQPLPIPERIWTEVSMDFIEKLPNSQGKTVIMVVVDRLSKYAHFMPLLHPFNASQVAQVFLDGVYKLHGLPESIVSDRDKVFLIVDKNNV